MYVYKTLLISKKKVYFFPPKHFRLEPEIIVFWFMSILRFQKIIHIEFSKFETNIKVIFGGLLGYSGDDINKFLWMVRIAEGEHPNHIKETNYFNKHGQYVVDQSVSKTMKNCLMYKLSYYKLVVLFLYLLLFNRFFITKTLVCFNLIFFQFWRYENSSPIDWLRSCPKC